MRDISLTFPRRRDFKVYDKRKIGTYLFLYGPHCTEEASVDLMTKSK